jgi:copper chaperone CopZ
MTVKTIFKITGMHCGSCAMNIDGELEDTDGVTTAVTNYAKSQTEITYNTEKISPEQIISIIKKTGYDAKII